MRQLNTILLLLALAVVLPAVGVRGGDAPSELVFLHYWTDALSGGVDEMVRACNRVDPAHPIRAAGFEHESFKRSIAAMLAGEGAPSLFSYWAGARTCALAAEGRLAPIDRVWKEAGLDRVFPPFVTQACACGGRMYGLPLTLHYVAFFYNKAIFRKLGLAPPATWRQFRDACATLRRAGIIPLALGTRDRWPAQFWFDYLLLRTAGPEYRERLMRGEAGYDDPEATRALCLWRMLLEDGCFNEHPAQLDWAEAAGLVHSGKAAMTLMGTWIIGLFDGPFGWRQEQDYDFFPFPEVDETIPRTALGAIDVVLTPETSDVSRLEHALVCFSGPGPQMEMSRGSGALAPSLAVPPSFYPPLRRRLLEEVRTAPHWAFHYDLATPPAVAELGLDAFKLLADHPADLRELLPRLAANARRAFARRKQASP